jgi:UPF0755 protein
VNLFRQTCRWLLRLLGVLLLAGAVLATAGAFHFWLFLHAPGKAERTTRVVLIQPGTRAVAIARQLEAEGVVADARRFLWLCSVRRAGPRLQAGEYAFVPLSTPLQVLERLIRGDVVQHRVTFPEGSTLRTVARLLAEAGLAAEGEILQQATDPSTLRLLGVDAASLEGLLFPDTYSFQKTQDATALLETMLKRFRRQFPASRQERARELGLSVNQIVTLASLVEKEARVDSERPIIAAVFLNRLRHRMPLQSDPTAVYDLADFSGPVTHAHLQRPSPYNTYLNEGLPPGPICNPGAKSLRAALYPADVSFLYFVSNNDGTHQFSQTLEEHNRAVRSYRQKLKAQRTQADSTAAGAPTGSAADAPTGTAAGAARELPVNGLGSDTGDAGGEP